MAKKNTQLKLTDIKKQAKTFHEQNVFELDNGSTITHYIQFPEQIVEEMLEELQQHYITMAQKEITLSDKMNFHLINFLIIKYFTHFRKDMPNNLLGEGKKEGLLDWINHFVDTGLFKIILDEVFLKDQVMKVYDKLSEFLGRVQMMDELTDKAQQQFHNLKLQNKHIFDQFTSNRKQIPEL